MKHIIWPLCLLVLQESALAIAAQDPRLATRAPEGVTAAEALPPAPLETGYLDAVPTILEQAPGSTPSARQQRAAVFQLLVGGLEVPDVLQAAARDLRTEDLRLEPDLTRLTRSASRDTECDQFAAEVEEISLPWSGSGSIAGAADILGSSAGDVGFHFTLTEPGGITLESCLPGTDFDTDVYLFRGDPCDGGTLIFYNDGDPDCATAWAAGWSQTLALSAGGYTLVLTAFDGVEYGNYNVNIGFLPNPCPGFSCAGIAELEPNNGPNSVPNIYQNINCGDTVCGDTWALNNFRDTDFYRINLLGDDSLHIDLQVFNFDAIILLLDNTNTVLQMSNWNGFCQDETLSTGCLPMGEYRIFVAHNGFNGIAAGSYALSVECHPCTWVDPSVWTTIHCWQEINGTTTGQVNYLPNGSPEAYYRYVVGPQELVNFSLCLTNFPWDSFISVYDRFPPNHCNSSGCVTPLISNNNSPNCAPLSETTIALSMNPGTNPPIPGEFWVVVSGATASDHGDHNLIANCLDCVEMPCSGPREHEPNGEPARVNPIQCGVAVCGNTWAQGAVRDTDWFSFTLNARDRVQVDLETGLFDGILFLLNGSGTILSSADMNGFCGDEQMNSDCLEPGTYHVFVAHNSFWGVLPTDYRLTVNCIPCTPIVPCNWDHMLLSQVNHGGELQPDDIFRFDNNNLWNVTATFHICLNQPGPWSMSIYSSYPTLVNPPTPLCTVYGLTSCNSSPPEAIVALPPGVYYVLIEAGSNSTEVSGNVWIECEYCDMDVCSGTQESEPNNGFPGHEPPSWDTIHCGETVCGSVYDNADYQTPYDIDWYRLDLLADSEVDIHMQTTEFYGRIQLLDYYHNPVIPVTAAPSTCYQLNVGSACLEAGVYYVVVSHNGILPPLTVADYRLTVTCTPCDYGDPYEPCQLPHACNQLWSAGASEVDVLGVNHLRTEKFGSAGLITAIDFRGMHGVQNPGWTSCTPSSVLLRITFYDRYFNVADSWDWSATGNAVTPSNCYGAFTAVNYSFTLPTPLYLPSGYVSIQGLTDPGCWFLWMSGNGVDGTSSLHLDGVADPPQAYDLNYCLHIAQPCATPPVLAISMTGVDATLIWPVVPGAHGYKVYSAASSSSPWILLGTTTQTNFTHVNAIAYGMQLYYVTALCYP